MASSQSKVFSTDFALFAANYLLDGVLTVVGLYYDFAVEANPAASSLPLHGIISAKFLGLISVMGAAYLAVRFHPPVAPRLVHLWRFAALFFSAVCVNNIAVLWRAVQ